MTMTNLTPHVVRVQNVNGVIEEFLSNGVARVSTSTEHAGIVQGLPVIRTVFGKVQGLPDPDGNSCYIVSYLVLQNCPGRTDVFAPATGPNDGCVRFPDGNVNYVTKLVAAPPLASH